ncbi:MAG: PEP/pyruvate-binding domain-containing protein [Desulfovibrionaceae bacterium]
MTNPISRFWRKLRPGEQRPQPDPARALAAFRERYTRFKELLESNSELLRILSDLEEKLGGQELFGMTYVSSQATRALFHAMRMVSGYEALAGRPQPELAAALERIRTEILAVVQVRRETHQVDFVLPYDRINREMVDAVGGKNANLGEVRNRVGLPVPRGFAISTGAFDRFVAHAGLDEEIERVTRELEPDDPDSVMAASEELQALFLRAELPEDLSSAILTAFQALADELGREPLVALRSSAIGEDSEVSYAGQYLSVLGVPRGKVLETYKMVLASLFTPRAILYRLRQGIPLADSAMSVACLEMVRSKSSGVIYSRHPFDVLEDKIILNGVWGLGVYAVDGVVPPDEFVFAKSDPPELARRRISTKPVMLVGRSAGYVEERPVPPELQDAPCLSDEQARELAGWALRLERHYRHAQDVEWALDQDGRLLVLQARPLKLEARPQQIPARDLPGHEVLIERGDVASPGVGCGPVVLVRDDDDLRDFPEGGVLVAPHSSPKFMLVLPRVRAVITDSGSVTGHMASLVREFRIPAILNTKDATACLAPGRIVTVDAFSGRVYDGEVKELTSLTRENGRFMHDTPVYRILQALAEHVVPLTLVDPKSPQFTPRHAKTLHDVMRFVHERCYAEMFKISDMASDGAGVAVKLTAPLPLDLYIIDVGDGLADVRPGDRKVDVAQVTSAPFKALLGGMLHPELCANEPKPLDMRGFLSVVSQQMMTPPDAGHERFGDKSYAIVSDKYLNFSSRVGYHYSILDAYCGQTMNKNYVSFEFKGGAADTTRRERRVRAIGKILEASDFLVETRGDRVTARFAKYDHTEIEKRLDMLGRLLIFTRQMDMLMRSDADVERMAVRFLAGDYGHQCPRPAANGGAEAERDGA